MAIGKAIPNSGKPHIVTYMGSPMPAGLPFPQYTVVVKFLTTTAPEECVPYLKGSPAWQIDRHVQDPKTQAYTCARKVQISHIIQVDVAVTDPRSPTGWVYGTFAYDGNASRLDVLGQARLPLGIAIRLRPVDLPGGARRAPAFRRSRA